MQSDSDTDENSEKSNSNDEQNASNHGEEVISEYEKQRLERIKENKARLEALRLPSLASSLLGSFKNKGKSKEKKKRGKEEDEEYKPSDGEVRASSSSNEEDEEDEQEDEDEDESPEASNRKGKSRQSSHKSKSKTKRYVQKRRRKLDYVDDDEALQQAIALSLERSSEVSGAVLLESLHNSRTGVTDVGLEERKRRPLVQEIDKRKKKRQSNTSRVQMTEDQAIIHFFQFDAREACGQWETKFKCKYCGKTMKDGCMTGLMKHLADCFSEVAASEHVPPQVKEEMRKHLSGRASSVSPKRVRKRQPRVVWPQEEEVEDPELRLQQDIEEAMRRSMKDPEYKETEEIKLAMLESQRLNSQYLKGTSSTRNLHSKMIVENSDDELDWIFGFDNGDDDGDAN